VVAVLAYEGMSAFETGIVTGVFGLPRSRSPATTASPRSRTSPCGAEKLIAPPVRVNRAGEAMISGARYYLTMVTVAER